VDKKQDEFKVKVDTKYGKYVKLGIAMLTTFAHMDLNQTVIFSSFPEILHHNIY
jgi:hypothetical protein